MNMHGHSFAVLGQEKLGFKNIILSLDKIVFIYFLFFF